MNFFRKILFPFSFIYGCITTIRNLLYDKHIFTSSKFKTPIIVVGNLSVGGTGKTPQIEYLIRLLQNNYKIAVLSRGYKRKSKGFVLANKSSTVEIIGDEPFQYYQKFKNIIVAVDADRTRGIKQLENLENPPEVILLDDAFQHRKVQGGLNILLTSFNNLYVKDLILPAGNLRESRLGAKRAQLIVVTKCPENISKLNQQKIVNELKPTKNQKVFFSTITYEPKLQGIKECDLNDLYEKEILLITGIANPAPLVLFLVEKNIKFKHLKYPDHYQFSRNDINQIKEAFKIMTSNNKLILTTEKDYVRIFELLKNVYYISIKTTFINHKNDFDFIINKYVEQSTRNSKIS